MEKFDYVQTSLAVGLSFLVMPLVRKHEGYKFEHWFDMQNSIFAIEMGVSDGVAQLISEAVPMKEKQTTQIITAGIMQPLQRRLFNSDHKYMFNALSGLFLEAGATILAEPFGKTFGLHKMDKKPSPKEVQQHLSSIADNGAKFNVIPPVQPVLVREMPKPDNKTVVMQPINRRPAPKKY